MEDCLFCKIAKGEIPSKKHYENDEIVVFEDIDPKAPLHLLIIPKEHFATVVDIAEKKSNLLGKMISTGVSVAREKGLEPDGYRFVINNGKYGGQLVQHIHIHLLGGRPMEWPPG